MKRKYSVVHINGITGVILIFFIIGCAFAGFILFPSWCCMQGWNLFASLFDVPMMNIYHGGLLWLIVCLSLFAASGGKSPLKVGTFSSVNEQELRKNLEKMKIQNAAKGFDIEMVKSLREQTTNEHLSVKKEENESIVKKEN